LYFKYYEGVQIRDQEVRRMGVAHIREIRNLYNIFVGKPEVKRPLGRPSHR
jgi:hypothetical protein